LAEPWEPATLAVTDNASSGDDLLVVMVESATEGDGCSWATTTVYEAMDGCGNSVQQTHVLAWVDSTAPSLTAPLEPLAFICASDVPSCEDMLVPGTDDCNPWTWTCEETLSEPCTPNNCALVRTVTLTDACGNASAFDVDITIEEPPIDPELPTGFSPNNDNYNDVYLIANVGPEGGTPPCEWLEGTRLIVFDRWGSLVFESTDVTEPWDGTNLQGRPLPVGTYFVVFETNGATYRATVDLRR
jgi:gliding motility-associated-like protein